MPAGTSSPLDAAESLAFSDLISYRDDGEDVSGDTPFNSVKDPMAFLDARMPQQSTSAPLDLGLDPLHPFDYPDLSFDQGFSLVPQGTANMSNSPYSEDEAQAPVQQSQPSSESPDILSFADPALTALFEDPTFDSLNFPSPEVDDAVQEQPLSYYERDLTTAKRTRDSNRSDGISACWTSPLCPRNSKEGTPPDPSTCDGACAPFLFADPTTIKIPEEILTATGLNAADFTTSPESISSDRLKRRESSMSSDIPTGRTIPTTKVKPEPLPEEPVEDAAPPAPATTKRRGRMPHNQVERKYRDSINAQLEGLRRVIPALQHSSENANSGQGPCAGGDGDIEDLPNPTLNKPSKAVILSSATAYIRQLERERQRNREENERLKERVRVLEKVVRCEDCEVLGWFRGLKVADSKSKRNGGNPILAGKMS